MIDIKKRWFLLGCLKRVSTEPSLEGPKKILSQNRPHLETRSPLSMNCICKSLTVAILRVIVKTSFQASLCSLSVFSFLINLIYVRANHKAEVIVSSEVLEISTAYLGSGPDLQGNLGGGNMEKIILVSNDDDMSITSHQRSLVVNPELISLI